MSQEQRRLLTLCAIRIDGQSIDWNVIAREVQSHRGVELLYRGHIIEQSPPHPCHCRSYARD
ncbi:MAG: hypothetical protein ACRDYA_09160 [Egibacteraceae bacterium]